MWGAEGPGAAGTTLLPNLSDLWWVWGTEWVGLTVNGSIALNKQFHSVADWLSNAFVFLPFFILVCDLSPFPGLYFILFFFVYHVMGVIGLWWSLRQTPWVGPGEVGRGKFPRYIRWYHGIILLIVLGVIVALWLYKKWPCFLGRCTAEVWKGKMTSCLEDALKYFSREKEGIAEPNMTSSITVEPGWLVYRSSWQLCIFSVSDFSNQKVFLIMKKCLIEKLSRWFWCSFQVENQWFKRLNLDHCSLDQLWLWIT